MSTLNKVLMILCCYQLLFYCKIESCTRLFWNDNAQAKIVARTMDLFISDEPQVWVNPRGLHHQSKVDANGLEWTSVYGSVSISAFHIKDLITEGLNEQGFAVHALALDSTQYEPRDHRPGIHYGEWLQYLLDTCKTVEEALNAHNNFQVVPLAVNEYVWPLHLMMEDATGDSAIVEFVGGKISIFHSPQFQVGTNDPTYEEHLKSLSNYEEFGGTQSLPTTTDSFSRFILASAYLKQLQEPKNTDEAIQLIKQTITRVFQKDNVFQNIDVNFMDSELRISTRWTAIADLTHRTYYFSQVDKSDSIPLNLSELNFSESAPIELMNIFECCDHKGEQMPHDTSSKDFGHVELKKSGIGQFKDGLGVFANRDFKAGEIVIKWNLKTLTELQYQELSLYEKENFCHKRNGIHWLYPDPERHVNRFKNPNVAPNFEMQANIALRDIKKGEELSIAADTVEDF